MKTQVKLFVLIFLIALVSCDPHPGYKYSYGELPESPVSLEDFNSPYDDYNSTAPSLGYLIPFCFSTNRHNRGEDFNVMYMPMNVNFNKTTGVLKVSNAYDNWGVRMEDYGILVEAVNRINTTGNEFGPYLYPERNKQTGVFEFILMYATDVSGDFDIGFTFNTDGSAFSKPQPVPFLNSEHNDLYPALDTSTNQIYFCSDRKDGVYHIYEAKLNRADRPLSEALSDSSGFALRLNEVLSSAYDDKCPFVFDRTMVFASNRPGGHGGFDLYYAVFENGQWSTPRNFGDQMNTADDEYRPILLDEGVDETRHMLVFSSNRSGGQGGFDLYFAGIYKD